MYENKTNQEPPDGDLNPAGALGFILRDNGVAYGTHRCSPTAYACVHLFLVVLCYTSGRGVRTRMCTRVYRDRRTCVLGFQ